ncbi:MAG: B12-binding domain-containing protein [Anaerofustis sp.]
MSIKDNIIQGMKELDEDRVLENAVLAVAQDTDRLEILRWLNLGLNEVGKLYEQEEYYIIELIMSEIIYKKVLDLEGFNIWVQQNADQPIGVIVLGTVNGDNHDIGKNIFKSMVSASGFRVIDLGVDVPSGLFIDTLRSEHPDILALSGILTSAIEEMKTLIDEISAAGMRSDLKILAGGPALTDAACRYIGADISVKDAGMGVEICKQWMKEKGRDNG